MGKKRCIFAIPFASLNVSTLLFSYQIPQYQCTSLMCEIFIALQLAYLPHKRRDLILEDENIDLYIAHDGNVENPDDTLKEEKKSRKNGLLNWLKIRVGTDLVWKMPVLLFSFCKYELLMPCSLSYKFYCFVLHFNPEKGW